MLIAIISTQFSGYLQQEQKRYGKKLFLVIGNFTEARKSFRTSIKESKTGNIQIYYSGTFIWSYFGTGVIAVSEQFSHFLQDEKFLKPQSSTL